MLNVLDELTGERANVTDLLERDADEYEFPDGVPDDISERIEHLNGATRKGDRYGRLLPNTALGVDL